ncbi:hypothetical protein E4U50_007072 [Claviceps purpurea]|nr:hypothetical protein E4U50_007072 [Claviceps purpurea]
MHHVLASYYLCTLNGEAIDAVVSSVFYDAKEGLYDDQWKHNCINNMTAFIKYCLDETSEENVPSQTAETFLVARSRRMARTLVCMHSHWIDFRTYSDSSNISKCL